MKLDPDSALAQAIRTGTISGGQVWISVDVMSPATGWERAMTLRVDRWSEIRGCQHEPSHLEVVTADIRGELAELDWLSQQ